MTVNLVKKFKDEKTLDQLKNKDRQAFIAVYDAYVKDIHRFVYFKIGRREEANDLTSMIFLKTWNFIQAGSLESSKTLRALLYKIARNAIVDYYRENGLKIEASLDDEEHPIEIVDEGQDLAKNIENKANLELINRQLPFLKDEYREVIVLKFVNDLELSEIAEITGKSKGNVRVLLHRALNALRELVEEEEKKKVKNNE
ncbi:MAG: RNA polymerase sigma factor [Candidatus Falkowbacteria bacterium]|nr:RNA polymerase sigma factor [Candidatus Falkowbacteria bacterium]